MHVVSESVLYTPYSVVYRPSVPLQVNDWLKEFNNEDAPADIDTIRKQVEHHMAEEQEALAVMPDLKQVGR